MADYQDPGEASRESIATVQLFGLGDITPQFVNVVHANSDRDVFQVIFSQAMPPTITSPEDLRRLREEQIIPGKVIARLVFTPRVYEEMIDVLQTQLNNYRAAIELSSHSETVEEPA